MSDVSIDIINRYLSERVNKIITFPFGGDNEGVETNVKVVITGIKDYFVMGDEKPHLEYTLYILPSNDASDRYYSIFNDAYGEDITITTLSEEYRQLIWVVNRKIEDFIKIFGYNMYAMCTRVINPIKFKRPNKSIVGESILDNPTRTIVRDIITVFKKTKTGDIGLPEDLDNGEMVYDFPKIGDVFSVLLELSQNDYVDSFEVDAELHSDGDNVIFISIESNPNVGNEIIEELIGELNEIVSHELTHIKQFSDGRKLSKEPEDNQEYYLQQHELDAQRKGFKRRSKSSGVGYEETIRNWFKKYPNKHGLNPEQVEYVIRRILSEK